jgi:hypothetical protein
MSENGKSVSQPFLTVFTLSTRAYFLGVLLLLLLPADCVTECCIIFTS